MINSITNCVSSIVKEDMHNYIGIVSRIMKQECEVVL